MRLARVLITISLLQLCGCPYESSFEPTGAPAPLRGSLIGRWICHVDSDAEETRLLLGWAGESAYQLVLRPNTADWQDENGKVPEVLFAVARRISGREIWSIWEVEKEESERKIGFAELLRADRTNLVLSWLGNREDSKEPEIPPTPESLAELLVSPQTKVENTVQCTRQQ